MGLPLHLLFLPLRSLPLRLTLVRTFPVRYVPFPLIRVPLFAVTLFTFTFCCAVAVAVVVSSFLPVFCCVYHRYVLRVGSALVAVR